MKRHWCEVASRRLAEPTENELRKTFRDIRSIVAASKPEQVAAVINLQLIAFDPMQ